jgi:glycosyltransferase involved in cell wall biosynthesis
VAPAHKTHIVPLGFDWRKFDSIEKYRGTLRSELRAGPAPIVSIIGRLTAIKDHALLFHAFHELVGPAHLCVVGGGENETALRALARELGIASRTHFLGFQSNIERILADTDVVALTSANEGTPVALIEGLAAGCSVVAVAVGGVPDVLEDGRWGRLVPLRTSSAIASALRDAVAEHRRRPSEAIAAAQRYARTKYGVDRLVRDHASLYEGLLARAALGAAGRRRERMLVSREHVDGLRVEG